MIFLAYKMFNLSNLSFQPSRKSQQKTWFRKVIEQMNAEVMRAVSNDLAGGRKSLFQLTALEYISAPMQVWLLERIKNF